VRSAENRYQEMTCYFKG